MTVVFLFLLWAIALVVMVGLSDKRNMWRWIVLYWAVLMVKNLFDLLGVV